MKDILRPPRELVEAFRELSTCNVSDALDKLGLKSGVFGIRPQYTCKGIAGSAVTMRVCPAGVTRPSSHMGADPINIAQSGDVIVIDNSGRIDQNCWGEILTYAAMQKGVEGAVIDGACRDVDITGKLGFPVYARGVVPTTGRGRNMQESFNCVVQIGGVQVRPGDIVMADVNGVVVIPLDQAAEVLRVSQKIGERERDIVAKIKEGISFLEVDRESGYDKMLEKR